jgi:prepilin-type N-terminal cleavage/methylation domain-containing protein
MIIKLKNKNRGFTLVEMLVAVALFVLITTFSLGAVLSVFDANRNAQASKTVVDNLNFSIENMARTMRFGDHYYCGISNDEEAVNNCSGGGNSISVTFSGTRVVYKLENGIIKRSDNGGANYSDITSYDTVIESLKFYVFGSDLSPNTEQPYIVVVIKGYVGSKPTLQSSFLIETLISQRTLDLNV